MDLSRLLTRLNQSVDSLIHLTQLITMVDGRLDLSDMHPVLLVASRERL